MKTSLTPRQREVLEDPVMERIWEEYGRSGLSMTQLGLNMGYDFDVARKSVWQFLNKTRDPRVSMVRKFATAVGLDIKDLL